MHVCTKSRKIKHPPLVGSGSTSSQLVRADKPKNSKNPIIWRFGGGGLLKPSECRHMGEGVWPNRHNFYSGWRSLIHNYFRSIYGICGGKELVENVIWERGWLKTSEYRHMGARSLKLLKNRHMIFERSLTAPNVYGIHFRDFWLINISLSNYIILTFITTEGPDLPPQAAIKN